MPIDWAHLGAVFIAAFLASLVEFIEALTIVLAVGTVRGWKPALVGAGGGILLLLLLVGFFGPLLATVPISWLQLTIGTLLLLFGMRWLRKAILRAAGIVPLHDELASYANEKQALQEYEASSERWDPIALVTSFKAVVLEGLEVVFIVIAVGAAGNMLAPAAIGAATALLLVILLGIAIHRPLARMPENSLKLTVGILLSAFGVFWLGEGAGFMWPADDLAILGLAVGFALVAILSVALAKFLVKVGSNSEQKAS